MIMVYESKPLLNSVTEWQTVKDKQCFQAQTSDSICQDSSVLCSLPELFLTTAKSSGHNDNIAQLKTDWSKRQHEQIQSMSGFSWVWFTVSKQDWQLKNAILICLFFYLGGGGCLALRILISFIWVKRLMKWGQLQNCNTVRTKSASLKVCWCWWRAQPDTLFGLRSGNSKGHSIWFP